MNNKFPSVQFYYKDFLTGTVHMSCAEVGAYIRLLMQAWGSEVPGTLENDETRLQRWSGAGDEEWKQIRAAVLEKFPVSKQFAGRRINEKMRGIYENVLEYSEKASKRGKKGAKARWEPKVPGVSEMDDEG